MHELRTGRTGLYPLVSYAQHPCRQSGVAGVHTPRIRGCGPHDGRGPDDEPVDERNGRNLRRPIARRPMEAGAYATSDAEAGQSVHCSN